ncbi:MAG: adenine phosphoribosyltransferase [Sphingosinicella sp.]|nr:adenine phosphoribosyltransferase [Sphingosinicella sp.]
MTRDNDDLRALIRTISDFPKPGIQFRDITTLLLDAQGFAATIERLASQMEEKPDLIAGIDARGFVFAAALALHLGTGLLLIRKDGKLPGETIAEEYALEYGTDRLAMHVDACAPGAKVALVDDLIATGGTAVAAARLIERAGASVTGAHFVIGLTELEGSERLRAEGVNVHALIEY